MKIKSNTNMLLFRFNNYKSYNFIDEHIDVIKNNSYVWMLKAGRKSNMVKINDILEDGGLMILKAPKNNGHQYYVAKFSLVTDEEPTEQICPAYYSDILDDIYTDEQWFKVEYIKPLKDEYMDSIVLQKNNEKVKSVIEKTRTSVMFVKNTTEITV